MRQGSLLASLLFIVVISEKMKGVTRRIAEGRLRVMAFADDFMGYKQDELQE